MKLLSSLGVSILLLSSGTVSAAYCDQSGYNTVSGICLPGDTLAIPANDIPDRGVISIGGFYGLSATINSNLVTAAGEASWIVDANNDVIWNTANFNGPGNNDRHISISQAPSAPGNFVGFDIFDGQDNLIDNDWLTVNSTNQSQAVQTPDGVLGILFGGTAGTVLNNNGFLPGGYDFLWILDETPGSYTDAVDGVVVDYQGSWVLTTNPALNTATLPTLAAVPVPAAIWLFGSGFLSLVGLARRKQI